MIVEEAAPPAEPPALVRTRLLSLASVAVVCALFLYEHSLVRPGDLRRLDAAFFTVNGIISVVFFAFVLAEAAA